MKVTLKKLLAKVLISLIRLNASYSNSVLSFGNLRIHVGRVILNSGAYADLTFPSGVFSNALFSIPYNVQLGWGALYNINIGMPTTSSVRIYQANQAGAAMAIEVITVGLA